jgi:hypothetical protein
MAAICGFLASTMYSRGESSKDPISETAIYYVPQTVAWTTAEQRTGSSVLQHYDSGRAGSIIARVGSDSISLVSYLGEPLPSRNHIDPAKLDVKELGALSPKRLYEYVRTYRLQLAQGGQYWKDPTWRQIGLDVAQTLSLVVEVKQLASILINSAQASEEETTEKLGSHLQKSADYGLNNCQLLEREWRR